MLTRRARFLAYAGTLALCAPLPLAAQPVPPSPPVPQIAWKLVIDGNTMALDGIVPATIPGAPGPLALRYQWQADDTLERWWDAILAGSGAPKSLILTASYPRMKRPVIRYALDGARLTGFSGPALDRSGGYSGPTTATITYQATRVLP